VSALLTSPVGGPTLSLVEAVYARFGRQLRRVRKERRMTQAELADLVELGRTSIVNIEKGQQRVHLHTVYALAGALGVGAPDLLPEEPTEAAEVPAQVQELPVAEREWVMRRLAPIQEQRQEEGSEHGSSSKQG
jgi:transcriptional regulator with XRE-family HTH domain